MNFVCPDSNYLESWNDANPYTGVYTLIQPTINLYLIQDKLKHH